MRTRNSRWIRKQESNAKSALSENTQQEHTNFKQAFSKKYLPASGIPESNRPCPYALKKHMHI